MLTKAYRLAVILTCGLFMAGCSKDVPQLLQSARELHAKSDMAGAIIQLKQALQLEPENGAIRFYLGTIYNETFDGVSAEKELKKARELGVVEGGRVSLELARSYRFQSKFKELLAELTPSVAFEGDVQATITALRGSSQFALGKLDDAKASFKEAVNVGRAVPAIPLLEAQLSVAADDIAGAVQIIDATLVKYPKAFDVWSFKADLARVQGKQDEMLAAYHKMLEIFPHHLGALVGRSSVYVSQGKLDEAQRDISLLRTHYKLQPVTYQQQAKLQIARQQFREAEETLQFLLKANPNYQPAQLLVGLVHLALGAPAQAEQALTKFLVSNPTHPTARRLLGTALVRLDQGQRALDTVEPLLRGDLRDAALYEIAGDAYSRLGEYGKASEWLNKAVALEPKNKGAIHLKQATLNLTAGQLDLAIADLERAIASSEKASRADAMLVIAHLARKDMARAQVAADVFEKKAPKSPEAAHLKGIVLLNSGKEKEGVAQLEKALRLRKSFFPAAATLANIELAAGNVEAARKRFESVLTEDKNHLQATMALADLYRRVGDVKAAIQMLERAASTHNTTLAPRVQLVELLMSRGEKQRAAATAEEALTANPDHPVALELVGGVQVLSGDFNRAIATFSRLTTIYPKAASGFFSLAQAYSMSGALKDAELNLLKALKLAPTEPRYQRLLIEILLKVRRVDDALNVARSIRANEPTSPKGLVFEGEIYASQGNHRSAANAFGKALDLQPMGDIAIKHYNARAKAGDGAAALKGFEDWVGKHSENRLARFALAGLLGAAENYRAAVTHYEKLLETHPNDAVALNGLAWNYFKLNDGRSRERAELAYKIAPSDSHIQDTLGWILHSQGEHVRARDLLERAARGAQDVPEIRYHFAAALAKFGDTSRAREELKAALSSSIRFPEKKAAVELLKSLEK